MGSTTKFTGQFKVSPPLNKAEMKYLQAFSDTRRMGRSEGPYYTGPDTNGIEDYNKEPEGQPSLWCQWIPTADGSAIEWDGGEKFYHAAVWIEYIIDHFLKPNAIGQGSEYLDGFTFDHNISGEVEAEPEYGDDYCIKIEENVVQVGFYSEPY